MTDLQWMDIMYPIDASLLFGYIVAKIGYRLIVRRSMGVVSPRTIILIQWIIVLDSALLLTLFYMLRVFWMLTRGEPVGIGDIVVVFAVMGVILSGCITLHVLAIYDFIFRKRGGYGL